MKNRYFTIVALVIYGWVQAAVAGTLIESLDDAGKNVSILIENDMARIESGDLGGYMLMDMAGQKVYAVSTEEHVVIDLSLSPKKNSTPDYATPDGLSRPIATFIKQGSGPEIAGYPTLRYKVMMGDTHCFDEYLARSALDNSEIHSFVRAMALQSQAQEEQGMIEYFASDNPCETAEEVMDRQYLTLGVPLRTMNGEGVSIHEVKRIQADAVFSSGTFRLPEDYPIVTRAEMMRRAMEQAQTQGGGAMHGGNPHGQPDGAMPHTNEAH